MSFALDLQRFAVKVKAKSDFVVADVVGYMVEHIDMNSPVGNPALWKSKPPPGYVGGRFRGNWQLGVDRVPQGVLERVDPSGTSTVTAALSAIPKDAAGRVYYYANNLPYAIPLEYGHSTQAPGPGGIVGITLVNTRAYVREAAAKTP